MLSRATMLSRSSALRGGARGISRWAQPVVQPKFPHVKIVATIGPASETKQPLDDCVQAGMRIMRINFSHATLEEVEMRLENLAASEQLDPRAVMLDTKGPEIRSGKFGAGAAQEVEGGRVTLVQGDKLTLTTDPAFAEDGTRDKIWVSYKELVDTVAPGNDVLLDDGAVCLRVLEKVSDTEVLTEILNTGELGDRKGVNLPGLSLALPAMSDKDRDDIKLGVQKDMDFVAPSFVRKASDVAAVRAWIEECHAELGVEGPRMQIISKIENAEALDNFEEILTASDGIMVARGDLGVEIPFEKVATAQKQMVSMCNQVGKPVIVATQMLESMQKNPRPTRAEVSDVANAVCDGADCVMLSGESAKGKYYKESISSMYSIVAEASEANADFAAPQLAEDSSYTESMAVGAVTAATAHGATAIVVLTASGDTARLVAKFRPSMPVVALCSTSKVARQLQLTRGVLPYVSGDALSSAGLTAAEQKSKCTEILKSIGLMADSEKHSVVLLGSDTDAAHDVYGQIFEAK